MATLNSGRLRHSDHGDYAEARVCRRELLNRHHANVVKHKNSKESLPLCDGVPPKQAQLRTAGAQRNEAVVCIVQGCKKSVKISSMRLHVAGHILRRECGNVNGMSACAAKACGFCGVVCHNRSSGVCNVGLKKGSTSHMVTSSCPQVYKMSYTSVEKGSTGNPCANRPVSCPICLSDPGKTRHRLSTASNSLQHLLLLFHVATAISAASSLQRRLTMRPSDTAPPERRPTFIFHQHFFQDWLASMEDELKVSQHFFAPGDHKLVLFQIEYILAHLSQPLRRMVRFHNDPDDILAALRSNHHSKPFYVSLV
eukprot:gene16924-biopygen25838